MFLKYSTFYCFADLDIGDEPFVGTRVDENTEYRPQINRNALRVEDVYPLEVLVSAKALESLSSAAEKVKGGEKLE